MLLDHNQASGIPVIGVAKTNGDLIIKPKMLYIIFSKPRLFLQ